MGYPYRNENSNSSFESQDKVTDEILARQDREDCWFLGTLIDFNKRVPSHFYRLKNIHNCITHEETGCDVRFQTNNNIACRLAEFFPLKWLNMITNCFKNTKAKELGVRQEDDRLYAYLAYIDLLLIFRGLKLLDSTLEEINTSLDVNLSKHRLRTWRLNLLKIYPDLRHKWKSVRSITPARTFLSTLIKVLNTEMNLQIYSTKEMFEIKHQALIYAQEFVKMDRIMRIKRIETWVRAICLKSVRDNNLNYTGDLFPNLPVKTFEVLENKRWQLDKILGI